MTLIGRPGCHLCAQAREVVARVGADLGVSWEERVITDDPAWVRDYRETIPVLLLDGRVHAALRVDEVRLRDALLRSGDTG
ncbi:MAG: glutaredoxin family protein [Kineosporiaceae bacterium]